MGLERTDFFTDTLDQLLLEGQADIAVHSAKDLPDPLPDGLTLVALTQGIDSADLLLYRQDLLPPDISLRLPHSDPDLFAHVIGLFPSGLRIGTSSQRRIEELQRYRKDLTCVDIRGNIQQRIQLMEEGKVDAVVIAAAALYRLRLLSCYTYLRIPGQTAPRQGQLALVSREGDEQIAALMRPLDSRGHRGKKLLYCGLSISRSLDGLPPEVELNLVTVIKTNALAVAEWDQIISRLPLYTHLLLTSKEAVEYLIARLSPEQLHTLRSISTFAIGCGTADTAKGYGFKVQQLPEEASSEGMVELLKSLIDPKAVEGTFRAPMRVLWPHSNLSRDPIPSYLEQQHIPYDAPSIYTTVTNTNCSLPDLYQYDGICFASPSSVRAFLELSGQLLPHHRLYAIGKSTLAELNGAIPLPFLTASSGSTYT
jgi:hydroxymethylbilane synthase